jgi:beta-glucosidase
MVHRKALFVAYMVLQALHMHADLMTTAWGSLCALATSSNKAYARHNPWPWTIIEQQSTYQLKGSDFPRGFIWATGTSAYQVEGNCTNSSYHGWNKTDGYKQDAQEACQHELRYEDDIALMANELRMNGYRFSVERSKIEPESGVFDEKIINHYAQVVKTLVKYRIRPIVGFHHYSDPQWFIKDGGFARTENIPGFVAFVETTFQALQNAWHEAIKEYHAADPLAPTTLQPIYLTFNSPSSYAVNGYMTGNRPPGITNDMKTMVLVLKNMLNTHVACYQACKKVDSTHARIGITHNIYQVDPYYWADLIGTIKAYFANKLVNDSVLSFFSTGVFSVKIPFKVSENEVNKEAPTSLDLIALNHYGHGYITATEGPFKPTDEIATDNPRYTRYAEGMHRALHEVHDKLARLRNIPIMVTENGIATCDPDIREKHLSRTLYAIHRALKEGINVIGYSYWSFMDNYEWGTYDQKFGLYYVDRTDKNEQGKLTLKRTLKDGTQKFLSLIADHAATQK